MKVQCRLSPELSGCVTDGGTEGLHRCSTAPSETLASEKEHTHTAAACSALALKCCRGGGGGWTEGCKESGDLE